MSAKIQTQFAVNNMKIMEDTLNKQGFKFTKRGDTLVLQRRWNDTVISAKGISYDSDNNGEIDKIKSEYTRTVAINKIEERGEVYEVQETANEITILVN